MVRCRYSTNVVSIHGPAMVSTPTAARIFGTNDSVGSLICVAAWKTLTMTLHGPADVAFRQEMIVWHFLGLASGLRRGPNQ